MAGEQEGGTAGLRAAGLGSAAVRTPRGPQRPGSRLRPKWGIKGQSLCWRLGVGDHPWGQGSGGCWLGVQGGPFGMGGLGGARGHDGEETPTGAWERQGARLWGAVAMEAEDQQIHLDGPSVPRGYRPRELEMAQRKQGW